MTGARHKTGGLLKLKQTTPSVNWRSPSALRFNFKCSSCSTKPPVKATQVSRRQLTHVVAMYSMRRLLLVKVRSGAWHVVLYPSSTPVRSISSCCHLPFFFDIELHLQHHDQTNGQESHIVPRSLCSRCDAVNFASLTRAHVNTLSIASSLDAGHAVFICRYFKSAENRSSYLAQTSAIKTCSAERRT